MNFRRLSPGHLIAFVAALALLLAMAPDWYSDKVALQLREVEGQISPRLDRETVPSQSEQHAQAAEKREKNAWQAPGFIDRVILLLLLATAALAIAAAFLRAADRRVGPPTPAALATVTGLLAALLVVFRILQPPGFNDAAVVKWGAPVGLLCVGICAFGSRLATLAERDRSEPEPATEPEPAAAGAS